MPIRLSDLIDRVPAKVGTLPHKQIMDQGFLTGSRSIGNVGGAKTPGRKTCRFQSTAQRGTRKTCTRKDPLHESLDDKEKYGAICMKDKANGEFREAKQILYREKSRLALLIGNGINLANNTGGGTSWDQLMEKLISSAATKSDSPNAENKQLMQLIKRGRNGDTPASLPEAFDIIGATLSRKGATSPAPLSKIDLQSLISKLLNDMKPGAPHRSLARWAERSRVPILTTNYDHCIQDALRDDECKRRRFGTGGRHSAYYPWDRYYAPQNIKDPLTEFALWHIHGDRALKLSIRAGLDQYMGMVQRLRKLKWPIAKEVLRVHEDDLGRPPAFHGAPWLRIFMGKKLWIQGLGLRADEVSIRWLLIQRLRYWKRYRPTEWFASGWYIHVSRDGAEPLDLGRRVFLESVGLTVIEIAKKNNAYCDLFR